MFGKVALGLGIVGILLGVLITGVSVALPPLTDGRTSWEEAMLGIIPGVVVLIVSFLLAIVGLIIVIKNKNKAL